MFWTVIFTILLLLVVWITIDYNLGKKWSHKKIHPYKGAPMRKSDALFFSKGDELFDHMFEKIEQAKHSVHIHFYIFREDEIGKDMLQILKDKAREGVTVRLMVDAVAGKITKKVQKELKEAGVLFAKSHPISLPFLFYSYNERNHRKITVIDGKLGYIGGYNVGDEYLGRDPKMGQWRDYHLFLTGEAVADLQKQFLLDWQGASKEKISLQSKEFFPTLEKGSLDVQIVPTDGAYVQETIFELLKHAKKSVKIGTPYFVPGEKMKKKLIEIAKAGIHVQVLIPKHPDHPLVKEAAFPYIRSLIQHGVDVRQFYDGFYHSKTIIVDDKVIDIGTANFDKRSFFINHEINCVIHSNEWIRPVKDEIEKDFYESSEKVTLDKIKKRTFMDYIKESAAKVVSPLL
ncbi:cardiolipin synthase [Evansella cellulosilytica]|uniref:Cardiolipin synthase n=1 Tax=Evansella cellulosilytica (strain ATCC 21833 / DSM 2522 / FERM P-1141 / JCM 9156 / N-4) TaxID=649639 RepID=E6TXF2_EVAC2|nr:cardiolipin synthase [Evansella cellulosilytica]ADU32347.1 phospholipase D/Transphosphatidylase [Evansella cellulosilytica DSM 2522]